MQQLDSWCELPTKWGILRMWDTGNEDLNLISFGNPYEYTKAPLVRVHSSCMASEIFHSLDCDCADQLHMAMESIIKEECGIIIHLKQEGRGHGLSKKIQAVNIMQTKNIDTVESFEEMGLDMDVRDYSLATNLLKQIKVTKLKLITNNPRKINFLKTHGFEIEGVVGNKTIVRPENQDYLHSKKEKLSHLIEI